MSRGVLRVRANIPRTLRRARRGRASGDQIPDCQVLGIPALPIASSIRRQASRASGCARKLLAIELRNRHMSARFG